MRSSKSLLGNAEEVPQLGDALDFMRLLWALEHALNRTSKRMHASIGLTGPQRLVIRIVGKFPGIAAGHLAQFLQIDPGTLTGILKRLESRRLIVRRADPRDRRRSLLGLTHKGRSFDCETTGSIEASVAKVLSQLEPTKQKHTRDTFIALVEELNATQLHPTTTAIAAP